LVYYVVLFPVLVRGTKKNLATLTWTWGSTRT
jgi:hypothetical protein